MAQLGSSSRTEVRRQLDRLRELVAQEAPGDLAAQFDPQIERCELGLLGLVLFIRQRWQSIPRASQITLRNWLAGSVAEPLSGILEWALDFCDCQAAQSNLARLDPWLNEGGRDVFERLLEIFDPAARRRHGFYCTPSRLAEFAAARADRTLVDHFGQAEGILASEFRRGRIEPQPLNILDPAVGTGAFLSALVRVARRRFETGNEGSDWSEVVSQRLLPRLVACDIQLSPLACAAVRLSHRLWKTGFQFATPVELKLWRLNPLESIEAHPGNDIVDSAGNSLLDRFRRTPFSVVIGNPPYGAHQTTAGPAMRKLMHGELDDGPGSIDYFQSADGPIGERKTWLFDHYVQFLRFAHWRIQQVGGIVAFVTNRGFLQHLTMRGLRHQWLRSFDRIEIHDFQGGTDRSRREHDAVEQNVFGVRSGIALSILSRFSHSGGGTESIELRTHTGKATKKLDCLEDQSLSIHRAMIVVPRGPLFQFQIDDRRPAQPQADTIPLDECFVLKSSAIVTARDSLVIGFDRAELLDRIGMLRDPRIGDDRLRETLFKKSRGQKYPRGDTRGWKLADARQWLRADPDWDAHIIRCSYRPLDDRYVYWHPRMIDWQRSAVSSLMLDGVNLSLVARRQTSGPASDNFFWVTRWPTVDGILRSDNRGNEFVFPLLRGSAENPFNLSERLLKLVGDKLGVRVDLSSRQPWEEIARPIEGNGSLSGCALFAYLVAVVFSPTYRSDQQDAARHDFIPIGIPANETVFRQLAECGRKLIAAIGEVRQRDGDRSARPATFADATISKPTWSDRKIWIGSHEIADSVDESIWNFHAGCHHVCRKWLGDRTGRPLTQEVRNQFAGVVRTIEQLQKITSEIESIVRAYGGWGMLLACGGD